MVVDGAAGGGVARSRSRSRSGSCGSRALRAGSWSRGWRSARASQAKQGRDDGGPHGGRPRAAAPAAYMYPLAHHRSRIAVQRAPRAVLPHGARSRWRRRAVAGRDSPHADGHGARRAHAPTGGKRRRELPAQRRRVAHRRVHQLLGVLQRPRWRLGRRVVVRLREGARRTGAHVAHRRCRRDARHLRHERGAGRRAPHFFTPSHFLIQQS